MALYNTSPSPFTDINDFDNVNRIFVADITGDGSTDLVGRWSNGGFEIRKWNPANSQFVYSGNTGATRFDDGNGYLGGTYFFTGDVSKDGKDDLMIRDPFGVIETWTSDGTTVSYNSATTRDTVFVDSELYQTGLKLFAMDVTGDKQPELVARRANGSFEVWQFSVENGTGKPCAGFTSVTCQNVPSDSRWYQVALNYAHDQGKPRVVLSPGIITVGGSYNDVANGVARLPNPVWPFTDGLVGDGSVGINVPSGVSLSSVNAGGTLVRVSNRVTKDHRLSAIIALLDYWSLGTEAPNIETKARGSAVTGLMLDGSAGQGDDPFPGPMKNEDFIFSDYGIKGISAIGSVTVSNNTISHVKGNGIDYGAYAFATLDSSFGDTVSGCSGSGHYCPSKVFRWGEDSSGRTATSGNTIIDARFTGIAMIGAYGDITNNQVDCTGLQWGSAWVGNIADAGVTMGISAAFLGTHDVTISGNTVYGTDYSIATDGSPFVYINDGHDTGDLSVSPYATNWTSIRDQLCPKYCDAQKGDPRYCPNCPYANATPSFHACPEGGSKIICSNDVNDANQTVMNAAGMWAVKYPAETPFGNLWGMNHDIEIAGNTSYRSIQGISLWRTYSAWIHDNVITSPPSIYSSSQESIRLTHSHSNWIYNNWLSYYTAGIHLKGAASEYASPYGSSYNGVGVKYDVATNTYPQLGNYLTSMSGIGIQVDGVNNSVMSNQFSQVGNADCDFSNAHNSSCALYDWTINNVDIGSGGVQTPSSVCNAQYHCP